MSVKEITAMSAEVNEGVYRELMKPEPDEKAEKADVVEVNTFLRVYDITLPNVEHSFNMKYLLMFTWTLNEDQWEKLRLKVKDDCDLSENWQALNYEKLKDFKYFPHGVTFYNSKSSKSDDGVFDEVNILNAKGRILYAQKRGSVDISCKLDLQKFPFDVHNFDLDIRLTNVDADLIKLKMCAVEYYPAILDKDTFILLNPTKGKESPINVVITMTAIRDSSFYIRQLGILSFVVLYGALIFSVGLSETEALLNSLGVVILTVVAFKFSIVSTLPVLPYPTLMDMYVNCTIVFLFFIGVVIACHGFYFQWYEFPVTKDIEHFSWFNLGPFGYNVTCCVAYIGIYIFGSLVWYAIGHSNQTAYKKRKLDMDKHKQTMDNHKEKMDNNKQKTNKEEMIDEESDGLNILVYPFEKLEPYY